MKFTIAIAMIAFTLIVGGYQFSENMSTITAKKQGVALTTSKLRTAKQLEQQIKDIKDIAMEQGKDQKASLERTLGIGAPNLTLAFVGQPQYSTGNRNYYTYTYRIQGPATFNKTYETLENLVSTPGFTVENICYNCGRAPNNAKTGETMVKIEGNLYVYNPKAIN